MGEFNPTEGDTQSGVQAHGDGIIKDKYWLKVDSAVGCEGQ